MPVTPVWQRRPVFVTSTFRDMQAERDVLRHTVFPQLEERLLERLENRDDRFEREYEDVGETEQLPPMNVTGVPEPEEWLLIGLAAGMLVWYLYTRHRRLLPWNVG